MMSMNHIIYAPLSVFVSWMFMKFRPITVFRICAVLMMVGSWTRSLSVTDSPQFWILFLGQFIFM